MKLKDWVLWLCVAGLLVTEVLLFSANQRKDAAVVQLRESQQKVAQLQSDLDQLKNSSVATLSAENARLRAENQGLTQKFSKLQSENGQLRGANQQLTQQLQTAHSAVQQQQQQLQQIQTERQTESPEAQTANPASESTTEPPGSSANALNACIDNLQAIDAAKQQWALENNKAAGAVPTAQDLVPYLADGVFPVCPSGGTYTINAVNASPTCSIPGHVLPQ